MVARSSHIDVFFQSSQRNCLQPVTSTYLQNKKCNLCLTSIYVPLYAGRLLVNRAFQYEDVAGKTEGGRPRGLYLHNVKFFSSYSEIRNQAGEFGRVVRMLRAASLLLLSFCWSEFYTCNLFEETPLRERNYIKLSEANVFCKLTSRLCRLYG